MGILRSLGALARALGPVVSSSGEEDLKTEDDDNNDPFIVQLCRYFFIRRIFKKSSFNAYIYKLIFFAHLSLNSNCCVCFAVYWIAGAQVCFLLTSASFIVPLAVLGITRRLKED